MRSFIQRHLDPASRLGEVLFGLIMALGFTGAARLGYEAADNRTLFLAILGCNVAWAIVDGVMYALTELFERGRRTRLGREVRAAPSQAAALRLIDAELGDWMAPLLSDAERAAIYHHVLGAARRSELPPARVRSADLLGAAAVALSIVVATLPILVPFLVVANDELAARLSNGIALLMLFLLGHWWGRTVGGRPWLAAVALTLLGMLMVAITIRLGG
ncbi:MAG: VIT family protein [Deltaproteobacteria bacterium]|nr:VIT family protein [Deltaproteobacteria bacterium]